MFFVRRLSLGRLPPTGVFCYQTDSEMFFSKKAIADLHVSTDRFMGQFQRAMAAAQVPTVSRNFVDQRHVNYLYRRATVSRVSGHCKRLVSVQAMC